MHFTYTTSSLQPLPFRFEHDMLSSSERALRDGTNADDNTKGPTERQPINQHVTPLYNE